MLEIVGTPQVAKYLYKLLPPKEVDKQERLNWFQEQYTAKGSKKGSGVTVIGSSAKAGSSTLSKQAGEKVNQTMQYLVDRHGNAVSGERATFARRIVRTKLMDLCKDPVNAPKTASKIGHTFRVDLCNAAETEVEELRYCHGHWKTMKITEEIYSKFYSAHIAPLLPTTESSVKSEPAADMPLGAPTVPTRSDTGEPTQKKQKMS